MSSRLLQFWVEVRRFSYERTFAAGLACALLGGGCAVPVTEPPPAVDFTEYHGGRVFDGNRFVEGSVCVSEAAIVECKGRPATRIAAVDGFIIPPFGDAHTHHFDGPYTFGWHRAMYLKAGVFYAMTVTAPGSGVKAIRETFSGPKNVDVVTSMGGITGPDSHPAEIYEALALGIRSYEEQVARAEEIRASRKMADDAYYAVSTAADLEEKWPLLLATSPDLVKVFLRHSEEYDEGYGKWGPGGGIDPDLLPMIRQLADDAGLRVAVANSSVSDFRASVAARADIVSHLPCIQDTMEDPDSPYYDVSTDEECMLTEEDARAAAAAGLAAVLVAGEWAKERPEANLGWERHNVAVLGAAGVPLAIGSNSYGSVPIEGLIAGEKKGFFGPARLLRLATTDTARLVFPERKVGCLDPGCEASFLVLENNPLEDFSQIRNISLRVKDGERLTQDEIGGQ